MKNRMIKMHENFKLPKMQSARRWSVYLMLYFSLIGVRTLSAEPIDPEALRNLIRQGNHAYNEQHYRKAIVFYTQAIQKAPSRALKAYLNMARAYNQLKEFPKAREYYKWYFQLDPKPKNGVLIREEYRRVKRLSKGKAAPVHPVQIKALKQLYQALEKGDSLMEEDGGALAFYEILMRSGFATPELISLQKTLARALVIEAEKVLTPPKGQPVPVLDREAWLRIIARIEKAEDLNLSALNELALRGKVLKAMAQGWEAHLRGNHGEALNFFNTALDLSPEPVAAWGKLLNTVALDQGDYARSLKVWKEAREIFVKRGWTVNPYFPIVHATIEERAGHIDKAVRILQASSLRP